MSDGNSGIVGEIGGDGNPTGGNSPTPATQYFDPGSIGGGGGSTGTTGGSGPGNGEPVKRGRGRPRGSGKRPASAEEASVALDKQPISVDGLSAIFLSIHTMMASFTSVPELALEPIEAKQMAEAVKRVGDCYEVKATEKTLAWTNLATAAAMVYGTRVFAYKARRGAEKKAAPTQSPNVRPGPGNAQFNMSTRPDGMRTQ